MASESTDSQDVTVSLSSELIDWLDTHTTEGDIDRDVLIETLLGTYRKTAESNGDAAGAVVDREAVEEIVQETLADRRGEIAAAVAEEIDREDVDALSERIETVEADFQGKIEDVRERVVQIKRETDAKAPAGHDHEAFERLTAIEERLDSLVGDITALEAESGTYAASSDLADIEASVADLEETVESSEDRLADVEEKLKTVGWAISDLREVQEERQIDTLDRIKAAAAQHDVDRAVCESCGDGVDIALMTRPACPHCDAAVTDVEPASGFFGKPALVAAAQIESGDDTQEDISAGGGEWQ